MVTSRLTIIRLWLLLVAALVVATLIVGGITRLTESGLSITEWKPVTGTLPPLSETHWLAEFEKYKAIPQYRELNRGMSLQEFKFIFWWEWAHRLLGRVIGIVFLLPFLFFLWRGWIGKGLHAPLWGLFGLGALQGAVGWWMVASGLTQRVSVSQYRLAFHLTLACIIYAGIVWLVMRLGTASKGEAEPRLQKSAVALLALTLLQIYLGALVAGLDAGLTYNTWPLIDGSFIPATDRLWFETPWWRNLFENTLTVQFNHRMVAYALWLFALVHAVQMARKTDEPSRVALVIALACAMTFQAGLGIFTLLYSAPIALAIAHQFGGIVVLTLAVVHAQRLSPQRAMTLNTAAQVS